MEKLLIKVYNSNRISRALRVASSAVVFLSAFSFLFQIGYEIYKGEYLLALGIALSAAVGYAAVTLLRIIIDAPRPYEFYSFYAVKPKKKQGRSFPSRHVYSAFVIATITYITCPIASACLFLFAICLAVCRVLLGIHFIRDVAVGAVIGIIAGALGILILV